MSHEEIVSKPSSRGFARMDEEKRREIARKGGQAAHAKGVAHQFTSAEAREAGRKGGEANGRSRRAAAPVEPASPYVSMQNLPPEATRPA